LQTLLNQQLEDFNRQMIGRTLPVLFEKTGRYPGQLIGKSPYLQPVHAVADTDLIGQVVDLHIDGLSHFSLAGRLAESLDPLQQSITSLTTEARA
jgi:tRNA-2-methylthio-N6-dimethylallyladenosine synthase